MPQDEPGRLIQSGSLPLPFTSWDDVLVGLEGEDRAIVERLREGKAAEADLAALLATIKRQRRRNPEP